MIEYAEALSAVRELLEPDWDESEGTLYLSDEGLEDDEAYLVPYGAEEWLVDGDEDYALTGALVALVDKVTGVVEMAPWLPNKDRITAMTPINGDGKREVQ